MEIWQLTATELRQQISKGEISAREVAPRIRVNAVSPGTIDTPMVIVQGAEREELYRKTTKNNLIPRAGTADEVAQGIIFVIKNNFVTGTTVDVDGGWLLREP